MFYSTLGSNPSSISVLFSLKLSGVATKRGLYIDPAADHEISPKKMLAFSRTWSKDF
jgi:hypothetical protein